VSGRDAFVVDDIIDTAGTLCGAARALRENGARSVSAFASHGLFNGAAIERIMASDLDKVFVTNTIPPTDEVKACPKIEVLSVAATVGEAIKRVHGDFSVSSLFWY
jgi:ribose-phosphate pyrophosphokinase